MAALYYIFLDCKWYLIQNYTYKQTYNNINRGQRKVIQTIIFTLIPILWYTIRCMHNIFRILLPIRTLPTGEDIANTYTESYAIYRGTSKLNIFISNAVVSLMGQRKTYVFEE